jgi:hypothetical protein
MTGILRLVPMDILMTDAAATGSLVSLILFTLLLALANHGLLISAGQLTTIVSGTSPSRALSWKRNRRPSGATS